MCTREAVWFVEDKHLVKEIVLPVQKGLGAKYSFNAHLAYWLSIRPTLGILISFWLVNPDWVIMIYPATTGDVAC